MGAPVQPRVDLHTHSTVSDGTLSPTELMRAAAEAGLAAIALTDHDTLAGLPEARAEAELLGIELVPGCELSLEYSGLPTHMLALFVDNPAGAVAGELSRVQQARETRNERMLEKLRTVGVHLRMEDVARHAGGQVGRPHIAKAMLAAGVVKTFDEAFGRFLGNGGLAHIPKEKLMPGEAIDAVHADGGLAILAHPCLLTLHSRHLEAILKDLMALGLDGVEVYYTEHSERYTIEVARLADSLGLLKSGGSDFHGTVKPGVRLGRGRGGLYVPGKVLDDMKAALGRT
ncbi:MAG: PHP domain-containing protein [Proteobacteria bacterium]|nr:PHP domain-containing protein [Pseudomonadota bacterium]